MTVPKTTEFVAMASTAAQWRLTAWRGSAELRFRDLAEALSLRGIPQLAPKGKTERGHLGDAMTVLRQDGYYTKADSRGRSRSVRWVVAYTKAQAANAAVGESVGRVSCAVTLRDGVLTFEGDSDLERRIRREYDRLREQEILKNQDVQLWLSRELYRLGCVRLGSLGWLVPSNADGAIAVQLLDAVRGCGWGYDWVIPLIPMVTSGALQAQAIRAFGDDIAAIAWTEERDPNTRAANARLLALGEQGDRIDRAFVSGLLTEAQAADLRAEIGKMREYFWGFSSDTAQRGALIWEELGQANLGSANETEDFVALDMDEGPEAPEVEAEKPENPIPREGEEPTMYDYIEY